MTRKSFERTLRVFSRRAPFRPYLLEFVSGDRIQVRHPEAVEPFGDLLLYRTPNRENRIFEAEAVVQFIDPAPTQQPT